MENKKKHSFQTETKKMLDIMIHSIYTHKEIFLRELISNASDALNKKRFESLSNKEMDSNQELIINISIDEDERTLTVEDNGIGMSENEVIENIGTVARSGSENFVKALQEKDDALEIIGQFGVGFYSSFMVANEVEIYTKKHDHPGIYWHSEGLENYTLEEKDIDETGTKIILHLREGEEFEEFLDTYRIQNLVKTHSNYIPFPIKMDIESQVPDEDSEEEYATKTVIENKVLNSMTPLWRKSKNDIEEEEYNEFYKSKFNDFTDPFDVIHTKAEGMVAYNAMLFIPAKTPMNFLQSNEKTGVDLYSKQVFIMKNADNLLPEYLGFVKGIVDSPDFSLNISRELLQKDRLINKIGKNLEKKVIRKLKSNLEKNREDYENWWQEFGIAIKNGIYQNPHKKDQLVDLLMFYTNQSKDKLKTLKEYVEGMKTAQEKIYYLVTMDKEKAMDLPQLEKLEDQGYEVLFFTDPVDEFMINFLDEYDGKSLVSLNKSDTENISDEVKDIKEKNSGLLDRMKEILDDKVDEIFISDKLKSSAVCLVTDSSGISLHTEELLKKMQDMPMQSKKILEINPNHKVFEILQDAYEKDESSQLIEEYTELLLNQALIMEGLEIENPKKFANQISKLMTK
ncbi:MAG TPA: molecular chaperone HtpG [Clostridia bacterium]|nr:molecular chaperone HtpG [Clostridia bacterium]